VSDTLQWCDENMSADDMLTLIDGLQKLVRKANTEDENLESPSQRSDRDRFINGDSRRGGTSSRVSESYFEMFPNARRLKA
jgi:hypothetical protein